MDRIEGFDGLRGLALLAVLGYHFWPATVPGGFVGVTLFFALSGFLITTILVNEMDATGALSLRRFYSRRVRRLAPPALVTLLMVSVVWSLAGWFTDSIRDDILYSLGQAENWGQVLAHHRYGADSTASPVLHFWSLAVEEQVYAVLPIILLTCRSRRNSLAALSIALLGTVAATAWSAHSAPLAYYSTLTRGGEVLLGALAALAVHGRRCHGRRSAVVAAAAAGVALSGLAVAAGRADVTDPLFSKGALLACALLATVAVSSVAVAPTVGRHLDAPLLASLGRISYAVYLFHWPLLQALRHTEIRPQLVPWMAATITLLLALASSRWMERPIRSGAPRAGRLAGLAACTAVVILAAVGFAARPTFSAPNFEAASVELDQVSTITARVTSSAPPASTAVARPALRPATRIGFFGDSKALTLGLGTARAGIPQLTVGASFTALGCPTGRGGARRSQRGAPVVHLGPECDWTTGVAGKGGLDVAVVWSGTWDVVDRKVPALGNHWTSVDDPAYRAWLLGEMTALTDSITHETGAGLVLWLTLPTDPASPHPERFQVWNDLLGELHRARSDAVRVVDVAGFVATSDHAARLLPDGIHPSFGGDDPENSAAELTVRLILPLLTNPSAPPDGFASQVSRRACVMRLDGARW